MRAFILSFALVTIIGCGGGGGSSNPITPTPTPTPTPATPPAVQLVPFVTGLVNPLGMESAPDGRLLVIEQRGTVRVIQSGALQAGTFLDIQSRVESGGEKGLLGLALHPAYATNRRLYVNYTRRVSGQLQSVISELVAAGTPETVSLATERILLVIDQPFDNHNGGQLAFGPDGFLYIAMGDGGSGGDPLNNGQSLNTWLGKILRIDVNGVDVGLQYRIPADNPFPTGGRPEIWAYGLRNPWRFSFDSQGGRMFIADVGQSAREEINIGQRGANYGWRIMEGTLCFNPASGCSQTGLTLPIHDYPRADGGSITGGFLYRGAAMPTLRGFYVFGDFISGRVWALREDATTWTRFDLLNTGTNISSFGRDNNGELYVVFYNGTISRLAPQ